MHSKLRRHGLGVVLCPQGKLLYCHPPPGINSHEFNGFSVKKEEKERIGNACSQPESKVFVTKVPGDPGTHLCYTSSLALSVSSTRGKSLQQVPSIMPTSSRC